MNKKSPNRNKIAGEIRSLMLKALRRKGWYFYENPNLCKCWEEMDCKKTDCPSYKSSNLRCWQISGTFCNGEPQGDFARKIGDCHKCKVYIKATQGDICLEIGEDFNNLMFQLKNKEDELRSIIDASEEKNRELEALNTRVNKLLEKLDKKNLQLRELSMKDGLTGLYNYRFFSKSLQEQYKMAKRYRFPLSCLMIDIDFFKAVNDTYGHQAGDEILRQLASILEKHVRDTDKVVRYGGEEFALLFPYTNSQDAYMKAERLRELVHDFTFRAMGKVLSITISIGVATFPSSKKIESPEQLVQYSDRALYQAKETGRNRTFVFAGETVLRKRTGKVKGMKETLERRKYPRIQTMVKVEGALDKKELSFMNTYDISCSGMSLVSAEPVSLNRILKIKLHLPVINGKKESVVKVNVEGVVVWCREIEDIWSTIRENNNNEKKHMVGVQFTNISSRASRSLQEYFMTIFEIKKKCLNE